MSHWRLCLLRAVNILKQILHYILSIYIIILFIYKTQFDDR